jgi:hypothetical protein
MFRKLKSLQIIFETFIVTLPALINVGCLLVLLVYIFSVLSMNVFAKVKFNGGLTENSNFKSIFYTALTLFRMITGDGFFEITNAVSKTSTLTYQCIDNPTYEEYKENNFTTIGCGSMAASNIIFTFFGIVVILIFLNLFIAIILEGYQNTSDRNEKMFNN